VEVQLGTCSAPAGTESAPATAERPGRRGCRRPRSAWRGGARAQAPPAV